MCSVFQYISNRIERKKELKINLNYRYKITTNFCMINNTQVI